MGQVIDLGEGGEEDESVARERRCDYAEDNDEMGAAARRPTRLHLRWLQFEDLSAPGNTLSKVDIIGLERGPAGHLQKKNVRKNEMI